MFYLFLVIKELVFDVVEIIDVLNFKDSKLIVVFIIFFLLFVWGKLFKKLRDFEEDDDGEVYEVMENLEGEIDIYCVVDNLLSYVNDRFCWVKLLFSEFSVELVGDSKQRDSGELYELMEDLGDYFELQKYIESKFVLVKFEDSKFVLMLCFLFKLKKKLDKCQFYENFYLLSDEKELLVFLFLFLLNKESEGLGEVKCIDLKILCLFCIEEKSI